MALAHFLSFLSGLALPNTVPFPRSLLLYLLAYVTTVAQSLRVSGRLYDLILMSDSLHSWNWGPARVYPVCEWWHHFHMCSLSRLQRKYLQRLEACIPCSVQRISAHTSTLLVPDPSRGQSKSSGMGVQCVGFGVAPVASLNAHWVYSLDWASGVRDWVFSRILYVRISTLLSFFTSEIQSPLNSLTRDINWTPWEAWKYSFPQKWKAEFTIPFFIFELSSVCLRLTAGPSSCRLLNTFYVPYW